MSVPAGRQRGDRIDRTETAEAVTDRHRFGVEDVLRATLPELPPSRRNTLINRGWHEISTDLGAMLGRENANIATFAVWSSVTVGWFLRSTHTSPRRLRLRRSAGPLRRFARRSVARFSRVPGISKLFDSTTTLALSAFLRMRGWPTRVFGRSMSIANRGVFFEVGLALVDFTETLHLTEHRTDQRFNTLADRVRQIPRPPGGNWPRPSEAQREQLVAGLRAYYEALSATGQRRAQLVLAGNLHLDAYEQARLDPWLDASLLSPWHAAGRFFRRFTLWTRPVSPAPRWVKPSAGAPEGGAAENGSAEPHLRPHTSWPARFTAGLITRLFVRLRLPAERLRMSQPITVPPAAGSDGHGQTVRPGDLFTPELAHLDDDVRAVYELYDPDGADRTDGRGTAVSQWCEYLDRMRYVAVYLRSRQQQPSLWTAPYDARRMRRIARLHASLARRTRHPATDESDPLEVMRKVGDPGWDPTVQEVFDGLGPQHPGIDEPDVRDVRDAVLRSPAVRELIDAKPVPPLLEADTEARILAEGRRFYARHRLYILAGLLLRSLPDSYAAANGVRVLNLVSALADDAQRRVPDTARMLEGVMAPSGLKPGSDGFYRTRLVRLMHAVARQLVLSSRNVPASGWHPSLSEWDTAGWGFPINQEDMVATILEFGVAPAEFMEKLGVPFSRDGADAFSRAWCLIGRELGVDDDLMLDAAGNLLGYDAGRELLNRIRSRQHTESWEGTRMTAALLDQLELWTPPLLGAVPRAALRVALPDGVADLLGVPRRGVLEHVLSAWFAVMRFPLSRPFAWLGYTALSPLGRLLRWVILNQPSADPR